MKNVYVVMSNLCGKTNVEAIFSCYEYAEKFCELENSRIEEFRKQDESFYIKNYKVDCKKVPDNQCYKKYWDYIININKDVQEFGSIRYVGDGKELVHINKLQDVEIYNGEFIYIRSYVSKSESEIIAKEQWQSYEQKMLINKQ